MTAVVLNKTCGHSCVLLYSDVETAHQMNMQRRLHRIYTDMYLVKIRETVKVLVVFTAKKKVRTDQKVYTY